MEDVGKHSAKGIHRGFGISSSGVVVGDSNFGTPYSHAAVFMNGSAIDLGTLKQGGGFSRANGINISGQVVGFSSENADSAYGRAFIVSTFDRRGMRDLGTLGGAYAQAWSINDFGFATGNSQTNPKVPATHAFIWQTEKGMADLGTLGGQFSYGTFINASNHVVGYSTIKEDNKDRIHAFLHDGNEMIDLGTLGGASRESDRSFALGINANDQVVGYSYLPSQGEAAFGPMPQPVQAVAFVWSGGVMLDLNNLIGDVSKDYQLDAAVAINDKGQIAAIAFDKNGGVYHAVLLTPNRK
jgi:probable HAF family extracellular repeat protein